MRSTRRRPAALLALTCWLAGCGGRTPPGDESRPPAPGPAAIIAPPPAGPTPTAGNPVGQAGPTTGATPPPGPTARGPHYYRRVVALCIGIQDYQSPRTRHALDAERDARSMADLFSGHYGYEVVPLYGSRATKKGILDEVEKYTAVLGGDEALIVFFSGHGMVIDLPSYGRAGYLVPYDADLEIDKDRDPAEWQKRAVGMGDLTERVVGAKAQHVLFLVNACCSGYMATLGSGLLVRTDLLHLMARRSRAVVAATTESQSATAGGKSRDNGFVAALRKQLSAGESASLMDVFVPVREATANKSDGIMIPQLGRFGPDDGEFVFIPRALPEDEVRAAVNIIEAAAKLRQAQWTSPEHLYDLLEEVDYRSSPKRADLERVWERRLDRFRTNAGLGDPLALAALAVCYHRGLGTAGPDPTAAAGYARRALDTKRPEGRFARGLTLLDGPDRNVLAARELLARASADGFLLANVALADSHAAGRPSAADAARADALLAAAEAGGVPAAAVRRVALGLKAGLPPAADRAGLIIRLQSAADGGIAQAQHLTYELLTGGGVSPGPADRELARRRLTEAAEAGHPEAQFRLAAECYQREWYQGRLGLPQDFAAARLWATAAAGQGHFHAKKILAMIYISGDGVERDYGEAKRYFDQTFPGPAPDNEWTRWFSKQIRDAMPSRPNPK